MRGRAKAENTHKDKSRGAPKVPGMRGEEGTVEGAGNRRGGVAAGGGGAAPGAAAQKNRGRQSATSKAAPAARYIHAEKQQQQPDCLDHHPHRSLW